MLIKEVEPSVVQRGHTVAGVIRHAILGYHDLGRRIIPLDPGQCVVAMPVDHHRYQRNTPDPRAGSGVSVTLGALLLPDSTDGDRIKHLSAVRVQRPCTGFHLPLPREAHNAKARRETC
jgi:hypothetical protein